MTEIVVGRSSDSNVAPKPTSLFKFKLLKPFVDFSKGAPKPRPLVTLAAEDNMVKAESALLVESVLHDTRRLLPICSCRILLKGFLGMAACCAALGYSTHRIMETEDAFRTLTRIKLTKTGDDVLGDVMRQLESSVSSTKALAALVELDGGANMMRPLESEVNELVASAVALAHAGGNYSAIAAAIKRKRTAAMQVIKTSSKLGFNNIADSLIESFRGITNLQLAPSGDVGIVHPLASNENAIGQDLIMDANRRAAAIATVAARSIVFAGPLRLIQNNLTAVIARFPVFVEDPNFVGRLPDFPNWWGFASMLVLVPTLIEATRVSRIENTGDSFVLYAKKDGRNLYMEASTDVEGKPSNFLEDPTTPWLTYAMKRDPVEVEFTIEAMQVNWVLVLWPREGFPSHSPSFPSQILLCGFFFLSSLISLYGVMLRESIIQSVHAQIKKFVPQPPTPPGLRQVTPQSW